jgi:hypothetical protein
MLNHAACHRSKTPPKRRHLTGVYASDLGCVAEVSGIDLRVTKPLHLPHASRLQWALARIRIG